MQLWTVTTRSKKRQWRWEMSRIFFAVFLVEMLVAGNCITDDAQLGQPVPDAELRQRALGQRFPDAQRVPDAQVRQPAPSYVKPAPKKYPGSKTATTCRWSCTAIGGGDN